MKKYLYSALVISLSCLIGLPFMMFFFDVFLAYFSNKEIRFDRMVNMVYVAVFSFFWSILMYWFFDVISAIFKKLKR